MAADCTYFILSSMLSNIKRTITFQRGKPDLINFVTCIYNFLVIYYTMYDILYDILQSYYLIINLKANLFP